MKRYIGVKVIDAKPMTRGVYNEHRGWSLPANEDPTDDGYFVSYTNNDYTSWSPKDVFDDSYREIESDMTFGLAIEAVKLGKQISRKGWNGKNMYVYFESPKKDAHREYLVMYTVDKQHVPWVASQSDVLAEDWGIVVE